MTRHRLLIAGLLALATFTASCGSDSSAIDTTATPATVAPTSSAPAATTPAPAETTGATVSPVTADSEPSPAMTGGASAGGGLPSTASVEIEQFMFGPAEVHVAVGGTVA